MSLRQNAESRFHELVIKECRGTITPPEKLKLDRYERLRNAGMDMLERAEASQLDYIFSQMKKLMGHKNRMALANRKVKR